MVIRIRCSCGKIVQAADDQAGRKVRCPGCQDLVRLPGERKEQAGYGVEQVRKCPGCKREWPLETVVCTDCGHNFETGRKLKTRYDVPDRIIDDGIGWLGTFTRYRVFRGRRGEPCLNVSRKFLFLPLGSTTYDLSDYRAILTDFAAGDDDNPDVFYLQLAGSGRKTVTIFRSFNEQAFKAVLDLVAQAGRLEIQRK
jgi:hypothetical protein